MPRRKNGQPVENEEKVVVAAVRLSNLSPLTDDGTVRFWVKDVQETLAVISPTSSMNDSTVNRALNHFVEDGWMSASWETADPKNHLSSKPRLYFRLTDEGHQAAVDLVAERRRRLDWWVLDPYAVLGEHVDGAEIDHRSRRSLKLRETGADRGDSAQRPSPANPSSRLTTTRRASR